MLIYQTLERRSACPQKNTAVQTPAPDLKMLLLETKPGLSALRNSSWRALLSEGRKSQESHAVTRKARKQTVMVSKYPLNCFR